MIDISEQVLSSRTEANCQRSTVSGSGAETETVNHPMANLEGDASGAREQVRQPFRRRLPETRKAITHKFDVAGNEGYLTVGLFEDGQPGELFVTMAMEGSTIDGLMDSIGTLTSLSLQYGVPLATMVEKFAHQRFEPSGFTKNPEIRNASSVVDYVFRWMALQFIPGFREANAPASHQQELAIPGLLAQVQNKFISPAPALPPPARATDSGVKPASTRNREDLPGANLVSTFVNQMDAPPCHKCGHVSVRSGTCHKCYNCGESLGCS